MSNSRTVLILGPSGAGKSTSIRTLNPETTFIFNALGKELPWRGSGKQYTYYDKATNPKGNVVKTSDTKVVIAWLDYINKSMPQIKDIVLDDSMFLTALELQRRSNESGWQKFNDIVENFINLADKCKTLRSDLVIYFLYHTQVTGDGILEPKEYSALSFGKLIQEKLGSIEAQYSVVLRSEKESKNDIIEYHFLTKDSKSTVKTPIDMFPFDKIPNDLALVRKTIDCYYDENC